MSASIPISSRPEVERLVARHCVVLNDLITQALDEHGKMPGATEAESLAISSAFAAMVAARFMLILHMLQPTKPMETIWSAGSLDLQVRTQMLLKGMLEELHAGETPQ